MTLRARVERLLSPGLGYCYRCERPWKFPATRTRRDQQGRWYQVQLRRERFFGLVGVDPHSTDYREGRGCFPLCEGCWSALSPAERMPFYMALVDEWSAHEGEFERAAIYDAVLAGL